MQKTIQALEDQEVDKSCYLGLLGDAYLRTGQFERAAEAVRQGLDHANKFRDTIILPNCSDFAVGLNCAVAWSQL
jgi:hypothetical protein